MADLESAVDYLMGTLMSSVTGIKQAPNKPPDSMSEFPYAIAWPLQGRVVGDGAPNTYRNIATIRLEVHVGRNDLPVSVDSVYPFLERALDKILYSSNVTLNGNVDTLIYDENNPIQWEFGDLEWLGTPTIGWRINLPMKLKRTATG